MEAVQIPSEIDRQLDAFSLRTGEPKDRLVCEAILTYLEDREDAMIAADRLKNIGKRTSLDEIGRKYGLVD
jgi:predicted DNA-binding protein